jgi:hypothetical protein
MPVPTDPLPMTPLQEEVREVGFRILQVVDDYETWHTFWQAVDVAGEAYAEVHAPFERELHTPTELGDGLGPERGG